MLAKQNPELNQLIYLPYADWLSGEDKFDEAQEAYKKAGRPELSLRIVEFLASNAVDEKRFNDAATYYWSLAKESLRLVKDCNNPSKEDLVYYRKYEDFVYRSEAYQAYQLVHSLIENPYQNMIDGALYNESIFNAAVFLTNSLQKRTLQGISKVYIYYALSYLGVKLEAFKTARFGYEKLQTLKIPKEWQEEIDLAALKIRSKPFSDKEGLQPICNLDMNVN